MISLDKLGIKYFSTEFFYKKSAYKIDLKKMIQKSEELFKSLDNHCRNYFKFPIRLLQEIVII